MASPLSKLRGVATVKPDGTVDTARLERVKEAEKGPFGISGEVGASGTYVHINSGVPEGDGEKLADAGGGGAAGKLNLNYIPASSTSEFAHELAVKLGFEGGKKPGFANIRELGRWPYPVSDLKKSEPAKEKFVFSAISGSWGIKRERKDKKVSDTWAFNFQAGLAEKPAVVSNSIIEKDKTFVAGVPPLNNDTSLFMSADASYETLRLFSGDEKATAYKLHAIAYFGSTDAGLIPAVLKGREFGVSADGQVDLFQLLSESGDEHKKLLLQGSLGFATSGGEFTTDTGDVEKLGATDLAASLAAELHLFDDDLMFGAGLMYGAINVPDKPSSSSFILATRVAAPKLIEVGEKKYVTPYVTFSYSPGVGTESRPLPGLSNDGRNDFSFQGGSPDLNLADMYLVWGVNVYALTFGVDWNVTKELKLMGNVTPRWYPERMTGSTTATSVAYNLGLKYEF